MMRKLILPVVAAVLLAGCYPDYVYRDGGARGDYYYGQPTTEYRYYGSYGGYYPYGEAYRFGYGYGGYPYGYGYGYPSRYGYGYGYPGYYPGYGYPGYHRPHRPRPPVVVNPGNPNNPPPPGRPDNDRSPWRNLDGIRRQHADGGRPPTHVPSQPMPRINSAPPLRRDSGSPIQQTFRRAVESRGNRPATHEQ
ncbi:MAG: hypothetical protein HOQ32_06400 [Lysobacter sp.]|nr:hypothetical protein [Lysobacter sp.]